MDKYYIIESLFNMVSRFSVPIFVMLSGAFLLHKESNGDAKAFYKKSCKKLLVPTLIVMAVFLLIDEISALRVLPCKLEAPTSFTLFYLETAT
jgi:surface polysaccharide O-acyltransferase-like enzyme